MDKLIIVRQKNPTQKSPGGGEKLVEVRRVPTVKERVETMLHTGRIVSAARSIQYDSSTGEINDDYYDPTRKPGFDLVDHKILSQQLAARMEYRKRLKDEKDAAAKKNEEIKKSPDNSDKEQKEVKKENGV